MPYFLLLTFVAFSASPAQIDRLIKQLASDRFTEREAAAQELDRIGEPALEALRRAAEKSSER
jgi:hypothetical protein